MNLTFRTAALSAALVIAAAAYAQTDTLSSSVITGTRKSVLKDALPAPVSVVGRQAIENSDEAAVMPVLMEQVPGLFVTSRGVTGYGVSNGAGGSISLRGFAAGSGRVLILIDGHPQFESIYGHPVADEYIGANAQRVEVTRGASSVLYGSNAMGGAINIITRKPSGDGFFGNAKIMAGSYGTARTSVSETFRKNRISGAVNLGYDRTDGHRKNSAYNSKNGMLKFGYDLSDAWTIGANMSYVNAYSENPGTVAKPMLEGTSDIQRIISGISLSNDYGKTSGNIDLYYNWGNHVINDGHAEGAKPQPYLFHGKDYTAGISAYQTLPLFGGNSFTAGLDMIVYGGNAYRDPVKEIYTDHKQLNEQAVYVFDQQTLGKFTFNAGLRLDNHSAYGMEYIPQAGVSFMPSVNTTIKASASKGFRMPNMRELYMYVSANEDLLPEEAWSYDLTFGHHFLDGALNTEISLFYTEGSNIIEVVPFEGKRQNRNVGEFANRGVEISADYRISEQLILNANYSYMHMDKIYTGAPESKFYLGANWNPGRFSFNLGVMAIDGLYLTTGDNALVQSYVDLKFKAAYNLTDRIQMFVRGANLLGQSYMTMDGFPEPGRTFLGGVAVSF